MRGASPIRSRQRGIPGRASLVTKAEDIAVDMDDDSLNHNNVHDDEKYDALELEQASPSTHRRLTDSAPVVASGSWLRSTITAKTKTRLKKDDALEAHTALQKAIYTHPHMIPADEERLYRALRGDAAVKAGERLFHQAKRIQQRQAKSQQISTVDPRHAAATMSTEAKMAEADIRACTFKPALSSGTMELLRVAGNYCSPAERFDAEALRAARARVMQQNASERIDTVECTFRPKIEPVSDALAAKYRRSTSCPSASAAERKTACIDEEACLRLYQLGQEQQTQRALLDQHIKHVESSQRVGGAKRLTQANADALSSRLMQWKRKRDALMEAVQEEEIQTLRPRRSRSVDDATFFNRLHRLPTPPPSPTMPSSKWSKPQRASSATPVRTPQRLHPNAAALHPSDEELIALSPLSDVGVAAPAASRPPVPTAPRGRAASARSRECHAAETTAAPSERSKQLAEELRRIRFRALYSKYLSSHSGVTFRTICDQVRSLFPHDAGVVRAIQPHVKSDDIPITVDSFVNMLSAYERRYGPQSWGRMEHHRLNEESDESDGEKSLRRRRQQTPTRAAAAAGSGVEKKPIYEKLLEKGRIRDQELQRRQVEAETAALEALTFKPTIHPIHRSRNGTAQRKTDQPSGIHSGASRREGKSTPTPSSSLNGSVDFSQPPSPHGRGVCVRRDQPTPDSIANEVDDLLQSIEEELGWKGAAYTSTSAAAATSVSTVRCPAPMTPSSPRHQGDTEGSSPSNNSNNGGQRTPLQSVTWNAVVGNQHHASVTPVRKSAAETSPLRQAVPSPVLISPVVNRHFAMNADALLDTIYCKVDVDRRYADMEARRRGGPGSLQSSAAFQAHTAKPTASHAPKVTKPFR